MDRFTIGAVSEELRDFRDQPDACDLSEGYSSQVALNCAWADGFEVLDSGKMAKAIVDKMLANGEAEQIRDNQAR